MPPALPAGRSNSSAARAGRDAAHARRVLLVCAAGCDALSAALAGAGFEAREACDAEAADRAVAEFAPHVVIVAARRGAGVDEFLQFARRLRAEGVARSVPLVVLCRRGDEESRAAALELGADDCFPPTTPPREALARLDALLWREEVGRNRAGLRTASDAAEREAQIDDFMRLLESARRAAEAGERFSVALVAPAAVEYAGADLPAAADADVESVKFAHDFLRLNLRRADSVAFYGPTLLVALLPRRWPRDARSDLTRLLAELEYARPARRFAAGLASFPGDGGDVETLIERADSELNSAVAPDEPREGVTVVRRAVEASEVAPAAKAPTKFQPAADDERGTSPQRPEPKRSPLHPPRPGAPASEGRRSGATNGQRAGTSEGEPPRGPEGERACASSGEVRVPAAEGDTAAQQQSHAGRGLPSGFESIRAVRESRRGDEFEAVVLPYAASGGAAGGGVLGGRAAEAAARERERRAAGEPMPRRLLLTVSDPARMAQINLLLRSAAYEVRAAFDGGQALDLLRIEKADLLVLDYELKVLDGLSVLRRLHERHRGRLPMPVALLLPPGGDSERLREEALSCGAAGIVPMPYDPVELLECVLKAGSKS